jgi:hypothetical protein
MKNMIANLFNGKAHEIKHQFPVLWAGWEMDNEAAVVEVEGKLLLVMTDHGNPMILKGSQATTALKNRWDEYRRATAETTKAMKMLS